MPSSQHGNSLRKNSIHVAHQLQGHGEKKSFMPNSTPRPEEHDAESSSGRPSPVKKFHVVIRTVAAAVMGGVGAILAWQAILRIGDVFVLPADLAGLAFGSKPSPENQGRLAAATLSLNIKNAATWMGTAGAILGILLAMLICLSRRSGYAGIRMIFSTMTAGALFGAIAGTVAIWIDSVARKNMATGATSPAEYIALSMHSATWLIVGLGIGFGIAFGGRPTGESRLKFALVIGLAAMVGGCIFPIVAGILFPAVNSSQPIPYLEPNAGRILWLSVPSVLMGLAVGRNG